MADSRLVPSNLLAWPRVQDLLPDQKLLVYHLWATSPSAAGCWLADLAGIAAALSFTKPALIEALADFSRRGLIDLDTATGEILITDWFRWHKFDSGPRRRLLEDALKRIVSSRLRSLVEISIGYLPREGKERKDKEREEERPPPAADLCSALDAAFEKLLKSAARSPTADRSRDSAALAEARALIEKLAIDEATATAALMTCRWPSEVGPALLAAAEDLQRKSAQERHEAAKKAAVAGVEEQIRQLNQPADPSSYRSLGLGRGLRPLASPQQPDGR